MHYNAPGGRKMETDLHRAVREACLWLPESEEFVSHGSPNFRVAGKTFATYVVNHHGDGRVALWLNADGQSQSAWVSADPKRFFVPPYVGTRGWLGVELNKGLPWRRVAALVREAYERVAPARLLALLGATPVIKAPQRLTAADIDTLRSPRGKALLKIMRDVCLRLPETHEGAQFGNAVWQAGRKTFAWMMSDAARFSLCFWVGVEQQPLLIADSRFSIPAYLGHNGWIALDATVACDRSEVTALALQSYRHFALQRMLQKLDGA